MKLYQWYTKMWSKQKQQIQTVINNGLVLCKEEIKSLQDRDVWELVNCPKSRTPIKCRWVYAVKSNGCKRAHIVAKGFSQIPGIDFDETFSPVA